MCPVHDLAVTNDTSQSDLGRLALQNVRTSGQVLLLADNPLMRGTIIIDGLNIRQADLRGRVDRPHGFGVDAMYRALTIWNRQPDTDAALHADIRAVSAGSRDTPIRGSGVFVGGFGDNDARSTGGRVITAVLETGHIISDGGITPGTPDLISGGVFVQTGANVDSVIIAGLSLHSDPTTWRWITGDWSGAGRVPEQ